MGRLAVRREKVILDLEDHLSTGLIKSAGAAALLDETLDGLDGSLIRTGKSTARTSDDVDGLGSSLRRNGREIDRFSGRLRLFADAAAVLGPSLVPIGAVAVPAVTGLASQLGFAALGMGSLIVASQGVGDALKAVNEAALEPTAKNIEKAQIAMGKLGPEAREFVARFQELRPVLGDIRDAAAAGWFPGLTEALDDFEDVAPRVASIFEAIGETGGGLVADAAEALAGPEWAEFLSFVETNAPQALDELGRTVGNLVKGMAELWMAFDPLNDDFSSWLLEQSRAFAEWSAGLSETQGFEDFVEYIRTNGPRVADALGAVGNAVLQIVEALAPLGGPSLKIIETFADVIGAIADSDLGTPILAGVAALALYNRTMQASIAIQRQLGISTAASVGGAGLLAGPRGTAAKGAMGGLRSDVAAMGAIWATAGARTERETARMNGALTSAKSNMAGVAKAAGPASLAIGALALVSTDAGEGLLKSNTAMLGLAGTMAGPLGTAAGLAVGHFIDLRKSIQEVDAIIASGDQRLASGALDQRMGLYGTKNPLDFLNVAAQGNADIYSKLTTGESNTSRLAKEAGKFKSAGSWDAASVETRSAAMRNAEAAEMGLSSATSDLAAKLGYSNSELAASIGLIDQRTAAANGAFGAETNWRDALKSATALAKENNAGIRGNSDAALKNRSALESLSNAWLGQRDAMEENGASAARMEHKYKTARKSFIDTAVAMGVPIEQARRLARELLAIPEKRRTDIVLSGDEAALEALRRIKREAEGVPREIRTNYIVTQTRRFTVENLPGGRDGDPATPQAGGGFVPKTGLPYADRHHYLLADGEGVTTNKNGETDRFRDVVQGINAGMTRQQVKGMLADGGFVGEIKVPVSMTGRDASYAAAGPAGEFAAMKRELRTANQRLASIEGTIRAEHHDDRRSLRNASADVSRSRTRSQL